MSDPTTTTAQAPQQPFAIRRIYLKDCSFETPTGVKTFQQVWKPRVQQELHTRHNRIADHTYEVVVTVTATVTLGEPGKEETAFIAEVHQAGIFHINLDGEEATLHQINVICPSILFPYAREVIDGLVVKGSFPALMLPPINFQAVYAQALAQRQANANQPAH